jgi:hypothetical protein
LLACLCDFSRLQRSHGLKDFIHPAAPFGAKR